MAVLRFLLTRRWLGLLLAVVVVGLACVQLGRWQFHRYDERHAANVSIRANLAAEPVAAVEMLSTTQVPAEQDEWRKVVATGTYDVDHQLLVLYRTRHGSPGVDVVTPLVTDEGPALLVDRGWVETAGNTEQPADIPAPPADPVTVTGWVRASADGGSSQVTPSDGSVRAISSDAIGQTLPYDVYDGFVDLTSEEPSAQPSPELAETPDLSAGPSFFYGVQWWFFAALAFGFWGYFAYAEYQQQHRRRPQTTGRPGSDVTARA